MEYVPIFDDMQAPKEGKARWAISRRVNGESIGLIQDTPVFQARDVDIVLEALEIPCAKETRNEFFPARVDIEGCSERCPTYALMRLWFCYGKKKDTAPVGGGV